MLTIDVSDNERDWRLFGSPSEDLSHWLKAPVWSLEDAVAISLGYEPDKLSVGVILRKCPEEIRDRPLRDSPEVLYRLSSVAQSFLGKLSLLERAVIAGELQPIKADGKYWLKPFDFLRWFDAQAADDWKESVSVAMLGLLRAWRASGTDTEEGKVDLPFYGAKGMNAAKAWLFSEMVKSPKAPPPQFKKRPDLQKNVMRRFEIPLHAFREVFKSAEIMSGVDWYKRGKPAKQN